MWYARRCFISARRIVDAIANGACDVSDGWDAVSERRKQRRDSALITNIATAPHIFVHVVIVQEGCLIRNIGLLDRLLAHVTYYH